MIKTVFPFGNGAGIYCNNKICVSIIDGNGNKRVCGKNTRELPKFLDFPFIRGLTYFFVGLFYYIKLFFLKENLDIDKSAQKKKNESAMKNIVFTSNYFVIISCVIIGFIISFLLLNLLVKYLYNLLFGYNYHDYYFKSFIVATIRLVIIYLSIMIIRLLPFLNGIFAFNGAGCEFFQTKVNSFSGRIYTLNFLNFLLNVFLISTFMISLIAININWWANLLINLGIFLICIILIYEFLNYANSCKLEWLKEAAIIINWLVCIKPNTTQKEVLKVVQIEMKNNSDFETIDKDKIPLSALYAEMQTKLLQNDRFEQSDMEWLVATFLNKNRAELKLVRAVSQKEYRDIMRACERRAKGEPLSNIFGFVDFYGLRFEVNKKVLSPRMETEILVEEVLKKIKEIEASSVLDLCTGSGAIAIVIAKHSKCKVSAIDISKQALQTALVNAEKNNVKVEFIQSDLFDGLKKNKKYDIIVSNPPYIKSGDIEKLDVEVKKYDPKLALDGGTDGLDFYRKIIFGSKKHLNKNGWLFFEIGQGQKDDVVELMKNNNFQDIQVIKDYSKIERIIYGRISK